MRERDRLIDRIRQIRRASKTEDDAAHAAAPGPDRLRTVEARVEHLESLVQGLQDSVHRESSRHDKRISDLEARMEPGALGKAISDDARARGL